MRAADLDDALWLGNYGIGQVVAPLCERSGVGILCCLPPGSEGVAVRRMSRAGEARTSETLDVLKRPPRVVEALLEGSPAGR